ncbi:MAG: CocE/NonD family hydrolase [Acidobacteria bacterium]|nr:CocE/NonD family hydrolase [Acidobacteriota bacterium]MBS1864561.1 CocE/NonD family hydrolase [Acidobacteriota bacterium]
MRTEFPEIAKSFLKIATVVLIAASSLPAQTQKTYEFTVEYNVPVKMRDGVTLRADIYRPKTDEKLPVLLTRTPYDKSKTWITPFAHVAAARGYVVILQDVRGRYESEGEWYPFKHEGEDGYDTIEWAGSLPYSNGKVGMFGGSYVGATQMLAALTKPPHLTAICPTVTASNYHENWTYQGGAFEQWFNQSWSSGLVENTEMRRWNSLKTAMEGMNELPLTNYSPLKPDAGGLAPYYLDWLAHPSYDGYWKQWSIEDHYGQIQVPVFTVAAWYDIFLGGSLRNFVRLQTEGGTDAARKGQKLYVGTGGHAGGWGGKIGAVDFGDKALLDPDLLMLRWYDHLLKGEANGAENDKPVKIFVMGKNVWRDEDAWPLARAQATKYFLHSHGAANGLSGDGALSVIAPVNEERDTYNYDPADATPTIGGPLCCAALPPGPGPQDQRPAEARNDVLVFTTPAFSQELEVTGPISAELFVSSSAVDTDFTAKLVDVWPNGFAQNLTDGILRMRYRKSAEKPELMNPGEIYKITVDMWATSNVFLPGHKLRLEISSSDFPRFDRNLNTGDEQASATKMVKATSMIFHDKDHPSALVLPVIAAAKP